MSVSGTSNSRWYQREVKIIPSLIIGCGGTGVNVIRHLKRRVRLAWNNSDGNPLPHIIQFYGIDTVSYSNRPDQEFLSPNEYTFMGGFDPQELINHPDSYRSIASWWDFDPQMLPGGLIHLGARQIRALGRLAFYYAFPEVWRRVKDKIDIINQIAPATQAVRAGYTVPIDTASRQVIIVSSICGGTGAGCFLDLAARIRAHVATGLKIVAILVMPSAFENVLPSRRQVERTQANAYAAIKELDGFWYSIPDPSQNGAVSPADPTASPNGTGRRRFSTLYPGDGQPTEIRHAIFDEVYLIGREGRGRSLSNLEDVIQHIAHFLYLTTIHNIAGPLGEGVVNLDRTQQFYSSFAVGALSLPDRKLSDSLLATLQARLLDNLANDPRARERAEALDREIERFIQDLDDRAVELSQDFGGDEEPEFYNQRLRPYRDEIALKTLRWILGSLIPAYGLNSIPSAYWQLREYEEECRSDIAQFSDKQKKASEKRKFSGRWEKLGRFGDLIANVSRLGAPEDYEKEIADLKQELVVLRMLTGDPNDPRGGARLLTFALDVLGPLNDQVERFKQQAQRLSGKLKRQASEALNRAADAVSPRSNGRENNYYSLELDPTTLTDATAAFESFWSQVSSFERLQTLVSPDRVLKPDGETTADSVAPSPLVQLLGLYDASVGARRTGHLYAIAEAARLLGYDGRPRILPREDWEIECMTETYVLGAVEAMLRNEASLAQFFAQPMYQNPEARDRMRMELEKALRHLMNHVKPFWGVKPFPDERDLEPLRFLSIASDPQHNPIMRELLKEHCPPYQVVRGEDPFRMDVLYIEHAARPRHVAELLRCKEVYDTHFSPEERRWLHLCSVYADMLPDPVDGDQAPVSAPARR